MADTPKTTTSGAPLFHEPFTRTPLHIPNGKGEPFKTELVVRREPFLTVKYNWWHLPDDDRDPHNHPWDFESEIIAGGYTEERFEVKDGVVTKTTHVYRKGDVNFCRKTVFHKVIAVEPGTVTTMVCGEATPGNVWGYINPETGEYRDAEKEPDFLERLWNLNPFLRPKGQ